VKTGGGLRCTNVNAGGEWRGAGTIPVSWPIQDILSLVFVCARIDYPWINPAHSHYPHYTAILLGDFCGIYILPPTLPLYAIHRTILVMTILCKGQVESGVGRAQYLWGAASSPAQRPPLLHRLTEVTSEYRWGPVGHNANAGGEWSGA